MAIAALLLLGLFAFPMWTITLEAPQYPKGNELAIEIHVNDVRGAHPHDLQNLNGLNHYIGMKAIEPDAIKELDYMPWILGFLVVFGLAGALIGHRWMLLSS